MAVNYILSPKYTEGIQGFSRYLVTIILILQYCYKSDAQVNIGQKEISILPVPAIGYSPETSTYLGAVSLFTFRNPLDSITRSSNATIELNFTWNRQIILENDWNWFTPGEKWNSMGLIHFSKYPDLYYGIGPDTPAAGVYNFESNRAIVDLKLYRKIKKHSFAGVGLNYSLYSNLVFRSDNDTFNLPDNLKLGISALYMFDSRNNILSPSAGKYLEFNNSINLGDSAYFNIAIDYRRYFAPGRPGRHVLAVRFYQESVFGKPPFYDFPMLGGDEYQRGYYMGRYRDRNFSLIQLEYRMKLIWRIGAAAFGGCATIYDNLSDIRRSSFKPNAGVGLRFLVDKEENISLRFDFAIGLENQSGFYVSFGESF